MKRNFFCAIVIVLTGNFATAQEDQMLPAGSQYDYWNFSFSMGVAGNVYSNRLEQYEKPGLTYNMDISLTTKNSVGFFANYAFSNIPGNYVNDDLNTVNSDINYSQFTLGPRLYSKNKNSFIDGGIGYYKIRFHGAVGMTVGLGGKIKVSDTYAVAVAGRFNIADFAYPYVFYSLTAGFEINNKPGIPAKDNSKNRLALGAYAGTIGEGINGMGNNSFGAELTYDIGKQTSLLLSYLYSFEEDGYYLYSGEYMINARKYQNEITGGVRLYTNGSSLRLFIEGMTGAYLITNTSGNNPYFYGYRQTDTYFGITFGGGAEFKIIDYLSGLIKTDFSNYISGGSYIGFSGGLKYRL